VYSIASRAALRHNVGHTGVAAAAAAAAAAATAASALGVPSDCVYVWILD